jgi:cytidine deaminase
MVKITLGEKMPEIKEISELPEFVLPAIRAAREAQKNALPPISDFYVGAVAQTFNGQLYKGANIEEAAFTSSTHAEPIAVGSANANGNRNIQHIVICGDIPGNPEAFLLPCLHCWQFLCCYAEKIGHHIEIISVTSVGNKAHLLTTDDPAPPPLLFSDIGK